MGIIEVERNKMIATVVLVAALFTSAAANGPSGSQSYGGYGQQQQYQPQQQQYQPRQQQERWYTEVSQASSIEQSSASTPDSTTPQEGVEQPPLPEGWSEHFDPNSGQYYYYNAADGTTSWDRPQPPETEEHGVDESENTGEDSGPSEEKPESAQATNVDPNPAPERERQEVTDDYVIGRMDGGIEKGTAPRDSASEASWQSNQHQQTEQPGQSWGGQGQSDYTQTNGWGSTQPAKQESAGQNWGRSNSTESSIDGGEVGGQKGELKDQPPQPLQLGQPPGWGLPQQKTDEKPVEPWGVPKSSELPHQYHADPRKQIPPQVPSKETQASTDIPSDNTSTNGRWGTPKPAENSVQPGDRVENTGSPLSQRQSWQQQSPITGNQQRPPAQQGPPSAGGPPPQQPGRPDYLSRQYPPQPYGAYNPKPYGTYNPNGPPGPGQYDPRYGGQNSYGRSYPPPQPQPTSKQIIAERAEASTTAVKEALSTTWKGLLGFGNRTRDVVGSAKDQVVTGATAAGQTISSRSSSIWDAAKSTVGGVFENNDSGPQPPYSLGGHTSQNPPEMRPPPGYPGYPSGPGYPGYPSGPGGPGGPGGRVPPPRKFGGPQQPHGQYGQQPRYGGPPQRGSVEPPGRQQPPAPYQQQQQQQTKPPGYPNMQPRRDQPYPQTPKGQERGPMQSQYGNQSSSPQPVQGGYPGQQRPPYPESPGGPPNGGPGMPPGTPHQEKPGDPWDHPALTGEY